MKTDLATSASANQTLSRRRFLATTGAAAVGTFAAPAILHAQPKLALKAVVIGLGGRGGGAGKNFLEAAEKVGVEAKIVAVADIFPDQARKGVEHFGLAEEKCFSGFDAYLKAIHERGVNYVILATPPGFRPAHFRACVEAGKHVFMEKPVAVDGPGCRIMYAAAEESRKKGLKVVAGTQRRHQASYIETIRRIHDGAIGEIRALRAYWVNGGPIWHRGLKGDTDLERQIHNWYHYIWLCGDHIVEQHVHNIDVCNWVARAHPIKAWGMGARQQLGDKPGEIWDNFAVEFEYPDGLRMHSYCGQIKRDFSAVKEAVVGSRGEADPRYMIRPKDGPVWRAPREEQQDRTAPYVQEHVDLIQAILQDTDLNEAAQVTDSTLTAIMGREAAYSGSVVEWEEMLNSNFQYGPELVYTDPSKMTWGPFRTLKPPMPSEHDIFSNPPRVPTL